MQWAQGHVIMTVLGALWYGPLFTKPWLVAMGKSMEEIQAQGGMVGAYALSFAGALVASFVLALVISGSGVDTIIGGGAHRRAAVAGLCRHQQPGRCAVRGARGNPLRAQ